MLRVLFVPTTFSKSLIQAFSITYLKTSGKMVLPAREAFQTESKAKATLALTRQIKRIPLQRDQKDRNVKQRG